MAENTDNTENVQEFATVLLGHAKGRAHDAASKLLRDLVEAVKETGKKGKVTVTLEVSPMKNNDRVVVLGDKVTATIPEEKRDSIWFTDDEGGLHRNDPTQIPIWETKSETNNR